ncbi:hypothetical protein [Microvirga mediterraneensis]|uniref:Uncharacterized protein n=1 Tax=Microvirga mediterraneensis TaxID=2754695 RepID=A0A838BR40_9HYPH|nr:hypothetical protein [Microvirga mediterraneensis]MBA1157475.1 hypothetical protein [Microvirga mediterraneensis]
MNTLLLSSPEKLARLRAELSRSAEHAKQVYLADLDDCGVKWKDGRYRCKAVGCPRCTRTIIGQQQRKAHAFFEQMVGRPTNSDMALLTVVGNGTRHLGELRGNIEAMYKAARYRVGCLSSVSRWSTFAALGYYEVDAVGGEHLPLLGTERRALLPEIAPISISQDGPTWIPSYHAIVHTGRLGIAEVQEEFSRTWPVPGQVHVKRFQPVRSVEDNISKVVSYSLKNTCQIEIPTQMENGRWGKVYEPWPVSWQADYFTWLHQRRNGFEFLRFSISPASSRIIRDLPCHNVDNTVSSFEVEPMPILF